MEASDRLCDATWPPVHETDDGSVGTGCSGSTDSRLVLGGGGVGARSWTDRIEPVEIALTRWDFFDPLRTSDARSVVELLDEGKMSVLRTTGLLAVPSASASSRTLLGTAGGGDV